MKILKSFLIVSFAMAIVFPLYTIYYTQPSFSNLLIEYIELEARHDANQFIRYLIKENEGQLNREIFHELHEVIEEDDKRGHPLLKVKFFSPDGEIIFSTQKDEIGTYSKHQPFRELVSSKTHFMTEFIEKEEKDSKGKPITNYYIGTYVPIHQKQKLFGVFEMYYDITQERLKLEDLVKVSNIMSFSMMTIFLLIIIMVFIRARNALIERDLAEKALKTSERKLETILMSSPDLILLLDTSYVIRDIFTAQEDSLWMAKEKLIGHNIKESLPENTYNTFENILNELGEHPRALDYSMTINGEERHFSALTSRVTNEREVLQAIIIVSRDQTEKVRIERLRDDVERIVRHDLKTPLNSVIGFSELIIDSNNLTDNQKDWLTTIHENGYKMLHMIDHSLDLFKMEEGTYNLIPKKLDLVSLFKKLDKEFTVYKNHRSIEIDYFFNEHEMTWNESYEIEAEPILLENLFANLIKNAIEASSDSSRVKVSINCEADSYQVSIHNYGVIPNEIRDKFFDRYVTSGKKGGTGLGTYSAKLITRAHGGNLNFTTSDEEGTTLITNLPRKPG